MTPRVVFYTRQQCGLCDDALAVILRLQPRLGFDLHVSDIDADPGLRRRFDERIPVVEADGRIVAEAPIDAAVLERALTALIPGNA